MERLHQRLTAGIKLFFRDYGHWITKSCPVLLFVLEIYGDIIMNMDIIGERDGYIIRLAKDKDAEDYFNQNYCSLDKEVARLTGYKGIFTKEEVTSF